MPDISQKESKPATLFLLQALLFLADAPMAKMLFGVQSEEKSEDKIEAEQAWDLP
ncbi:MAG: hypothetical protein RQM95_00140 [Syntrophaceticus schinkii]